MLFGLCCLGWIARPFLRKTIAASGLLQGSLTIVAGALMLLATNFAFSGQLAWTPGGIGVAFGRMLQDGIVTQYLRDHCPHEKLKLCPYRNELPATADEFLWGHSMFDKLGRFNGLNDEMGHIVTGALADYPAWQAEAALKATAQQLAACRDRRRHRRLAAAHLRDHQVLHPLPDQADERRASAALGHQFRRGELAACAGGAWDRWRWSWRCSATGCSGAGWTN